MQSLEHERAALQGQVMKTDEMEAHYINEVKTLERHIDGLTREL